MGCGDYSLYALNPNGTKKWSFPTGSFISQVPTIGYDGTIYVGSRDNMLYAINPDGTEKWNYTADNSFNYGSPTIGSDGTVYVGNRDKNVYAINPDGTLKWSNSTGGYLYYCPAIGSGGTVYAGSYDCKLYAFNPDGTIKWTNSTGGKIRSSPAIGSDGTIYVADDDCYLYAFNPDGSMEWENQTGGKIYYSSPVLGSDGTIYLGTRDNCIYAVNPDATLKWKYQTGDSVDVPSAMGSDGTLYVGSDEGKLYAFRDTKPEAPVANFNTELTSGNIPFTVQFNDLSENSPISWFWDFGDGDDTNSTEQNPVHTYTTAGTYTVTLTAINSGGNNTESKIDYVIVTSVVVTPNANFIAEPTTGGVPLTVQFTDLSENYPTEWLWDFGDGDDTNSTEQNPVHTYTIPGKYSVNLTAANSAGNNTGYKTELIDVGYVVPTANFSAEPTYGAIPLTVQFTDLSENFPTEWLWDFGDGNYTNSTEQNPVHTYTEAGTYNVNLTATNIAGNHTESKTGCIIVITTPVADFNADPTSGNVPLTVQFNDLSENLPTSWSWDFGDGDTTNSTESNPIHTYIASGTYSVTLTATNSAGSGVESKTGYINVESLVPGESAPVASFTTNSSSGRVPYTVRFSDTTTGNVTSWYWDFGDGGNSTEQNPVHTYVTEGTQTATLWATGPSGTTKATVTMAVDAPVTTRDYGSPNGGVPLTTVQEGNVSGGLWHDSYPGFDFSAEKTFVLPASYTKIKWARLYADVYCGHMENDNPTALTIDIDANGDGTYELQTTETLSTSYSGVPVWLNDHVNRVTSDYLIWYDLTDNITGPEVNIKATGLSQIKQITLVVAYDDGDEDEIHYWVNQGHDTANYGGYTGSTEFATSIISGFDTANLTSIHCASNDGIYTFNGKSPPSGDLQNSLQGSYFGYKDWNVSEYFPSGQDSTFTYTNSSSSPDWCFYKIQLALLTVSGAESSGGTAPGTDFSANMTSGAPPLTVKFTDESMGSPNSWSWDFGDGETSDEQNPVHTFGASGNYTVTLTAGNSYGTNTEEKSSYISVLRAGTDISITESVVPLVSSAVFAREPNTVRILSLKNGGNETVTDIEIDLYASDVFGPVNRTTVASLESGEALRVQIIDPTIKSLRSTRRTTIRAGPRNP